MHTPPEIPPLIYARMGISRNKPGIVTFTFRERGAWCTAGLCFRYARTFLVRFVNRRGRRMARYRRKLGLSGAGLSVKGECWCKAISMFYWGAKLGVADFYERESLYSKEVDSANWKHVHTPPHLLYFWWAVSG